ncbi:MAG: leucine--tRNA ligase [Acidobacteria bacterium]|nr:leucine--tRNA ligase [Acidobacteriota bacterium]
MSSNEYEFATIETKWQRRWREMALFDARADDPRPKCYVLCMYPYPSGVLHMGHVINYTIGDVIVRYKLLRGFKVLSPMGWDSFGLPAENAAIRTGVHPHEFTERNIARMTGQMTRAGWGYDWSREVATSHPDYYRWTQWFFLKFLEKGLAFKKKAPVNWCPSCQTVLANEQVKEGCCERCGTRVEQKDMDQWFFKMSAYAQRLLDNHAALEGAWPESVIKLQKEWIGRSEGARVFFKVAETGDEVPVFTTRPDTLWGVTFLSLAPEHPLVEKLVRGTEHEARVMAAVREMRAAGTSEKELAEREKVGVFTGFHVVNPVNGEQVPLWVANFALMTYGTGAVMAVPAHDQRDFEFARKYDIPIRVVIEPDGQELDPGTMEEAYTDPGTMTASGPFTGRRNTEAMGDIIAWLAQHGLGKAEINYKLRDWLVSRQRYWGAPIPVVYCDRCGIVPVPEEELPVLLPTDVQFVEGAGNPLATSESFVVTTCPRCGGPARRETDTMDTFVDSSWYFLRYCDPRNEARPFGEEAVRHWMPVDQYIGGIEHATMHLIYARFFTMVLHDLGLIDFDEPFTRLFCQGMVCKTAYYCAEHKYIPEKDVAGGHREGDAIVGGTCALCGGPVTPEMTKISKSKFNIVDPDAMMDRFGADTVRLYMLSDAPPDRMQIWSENGINGAWRTVNRLWALVVSNLGSLSGMGEPIPAELDETNREIRRRTHQAIGKVTGAIEGAFQFNTAIARCNELLNLVRSNEGRMHPAVLRETLETVVKIMSPIAPHMAEELWERMGHGGSIFTAGWPEADPAVAAEERIEIPVQVNGKVRSRLHVAPDVPREELERMALADERVQRFIGDKRVIKVIVVPGRLINVAVR